MHPAIRSLLKYKLHHLLFWIVYFLIWVQIYREYYANIYDLYKVTLVYAVAHAATFYATGYFLIPVLLRRKKIVLFIATFIVLLSAVVIFMYFSIQWILGVRLVGTFGSSLLSVLTFFTFSILFMTALLLGIKTILDNIRNQRSEERKEKERLETELQYLKAQVNPHFLFNTINSVYVLIRKDPEKASETLIKLSDLLRAQLYDFGRNTISIEQEISYLENYIELEKMRKGNNLIFVYEKSNSLNGFKIAPLLLMPFLENCFKHVSSFSDKENFIKMELDHDGTMLIATFYNSREDNNQDERLGGIGLKNVRRRLELLYRNAYQLEINNRPDSFEVNLTIDTNESKD